MATSDERLKALRDRIGDFDELEAAKETAMCRRNVKKSHRPHVSRVIDEFVSLLESV